MPGETIRDVVIRIALQQVQSKIAAPDVAPTIQAQQKVTQAVAEGYRLQESAYKAARANRIQEVRDAEFFALMNRIATQANHDENAKLIQAEQQQRRRFVAEQMQMEQQLAAERQRQSQRGRLLLTNASEGAEGVMRLVRGLALLNAQDKDLERIARTLVKFQVGFDVIAGGAKTLKIGTDLMQSFGNISAEAAGKIASTAGKAGVVAAAAYITITAALNQYVKSLDEEAARQAQRDRIRFANRDNNPLMDSDPAITITRVRSEEAIRAREQQNEALQRARQAEFSRKATDDEVRRLNIQKERMALDPITLETGRLNTRRQLLDIENELVEARRRFATPDAGETSNVAMQQREAEWAERGVALHRERVGAIREAGDWLRENLKTQQQLVKSAEDAVRAEKQKIQSMEAGVGRLDPGQLAELRRLSNKQRAGGELNREELQRLEGLGGSAVRGFTERQFAERGRGAGAEELLLPFADLGQGEKFDSRLNRLRDDAAKQREGLNDFLDAVANNDRELTMAIEKLTRALESANANRREALDAAAAEAARNESERKALNRG